MGLTGFLCELELEEDELFLDFLGAFLGITGLACFELDELDFEELECFREGLVCGLADDFFLSSFFF